MHVYLSRVPTLYFICITYVFIYETSRLDKNVVKQANAKV